jgi:hypothetical protein
MLMLILGMGAIGFFGYRYAKQAMRAPEDTEALKALAPQYGYESSINYIRQQPVPADGFSFVVVGDTRSDILSAALVFQQIAAEKPLFIMNTGDIVRPATPETYTEHHLKLVKSIAPVPVIPVPGDYEAGLNKDFAQFRALYGGDRFAFDYGDCRFVGINNCDERRITEILKYLQTKLAPGGVRDKFVFMHNPPNFLKNSLKRGFDRKADDFHELMKKMNVRHVFMGQIHGFATEVLDGVHYTITGGGGSPITDQLGLGGNVRNYIVVNVRTEGVDTIAIRNIVGSWERTPI